MQKFPRLGSSIRGFRGGALRRGGVRKTRPFGRLRDLGRGCRQGDASPTK